MKTLWNLIKNLLGFPMGSPLDEPMVTMREARDCHVAAVATACGITYEAASRALWHWNLPWFLESPIISNPWNVERAIRSLGFTIDKSAGVDQLINNSLPEGKVILLVHNPDSWWKSLLMQHWVVWFGNTPNGHEIHWGKHSDNFELKTNDELRNLINKGWPTRVLVIRKN